MPSFLVTYDTGEGQTAKVAAYVDSVLSDRGHDVTTRHVSNLSTVSVDEFDAVAVGSPLNNRRHLPAVIEFVERNREALAARPSAFFQLSMASAIPLRWAREGAMDYVEDTIEATGWHPDRVGLFAGAVKYTKYDRPTRLLFKLVSMVTTGDTDTTRDYEYTDWDEVERFAADFAEYVEAQGERARPSLTTATTAISSPGFRRAVALVGLASVAYWLAKRRRSLGVGSAGERGSVPTEPAEPVRP